MQEADGAREEQSTAEREPAFQDRMEPSRRPNVAVVLEALTALEEEFKTVLASRPNP
jgi:hypothetical protein